MSRALGAAVLNFVGACAAVTASAADLKMSVKAPPAVEAAASWTGLYVGVHGGYASGDRRVAFASNDPLSATINPRDPLQNSRYDTRGGFGGFQIGYNWQVLPQWVLGLEADVSAGKLIGTGNSANISSIGAAVFASSERVEWFGTARARFGFLATPQLLLYGTGGLAYGEVEHSANYNFIEQPGAFGLSLGGFGAAFTPGVPAFTGASSNIELGWTGGGGFEWAFTPKLSLKTEYLYLNLRSHSVRASSIPLVLSTPSSFGVLYNDTAFHTVRAGLNYRF